MLRVLRRHARTCVHRTEESVGRDLQRCDCALVLHGEDHRGIRFNREALHTNDVARATSILNDMNAGKITAVPGRQEVWELEEALKYYRDVLASEFKRREGTITSHLYVHKSLIKYMKDHSPKRRIMYLRDINNRMLSDWIQTWGKKVDGEWMPLEDSSQNKRINVIKRLFAYAKDMNWIQENPALKLGCPNRKSVGQTEPFDMDYELPRLMEALPKWAESRKLGVRPARRGVWSHHPYTCLAFLLVLRWTGLRFSDAMKFNPAQLKPMTVNGKQMYCYFARKQKKTDAPVFVPLRPQDVEPILKCKWLTKEYAFWDGKSPADKWNQRFRKGCLRYLERTSGIENIHPHRFRDTFAVDLLRRGVEIRAVSRLLGHRSIKTTMDMYEHYIKSDQDKLVTAVMDAYANEEALTLKNVVMFPGQEMAG